MSEIRATTISDAAGTGPIDLYKQSAAKAWVNFNSNSGSYSGQSFNVSSFTDVGTGNAEINLTNASASVYSPVVGMTGSNSSRNLQAANPPLSTTSVIEARTYSSNGTLADVGSNMLALMGDLA